MQDWPASGEVIRGRAGGGGDDDAVSDGRVVQMAIDPDFDANHPWLSSTHQHDVVERHQRVGRPMRLDLRLEHRALVHPEIAFEVEGQLLVYLTRLKLGQESDATKVDAEDRHMLLGADAR